jgi:hypothetical protein
MENLLMTLISRFSSDVMFTDMFWNLRENCLDDDFVKTTNTPEEAGRAESFPACDWPL